MLELLILLPMIMVTILSMTFDVSVDELTNVSRGNYFSYDVSKDDYHSLERKVIYVNHIVLRGGDVAKPECTTITVEKHLKCSCSCSITKEDCSAKQVLNPSACRCECPQPPKQQQKCKESGKEWDSFNCNCICPSHLSHMCSTGAFFHPELCRCIAIDRPTGSRRRRPPV